MDSKCAKCGYPRPYGTYCWRCYPEAEAHRKAYFASSRKGVPVLCKDDVRRSTNYLFPKSESVKIFKLVKRDETCSDFEEVLDGLMGLRPGDEFYAENYLAVYRATGYPDEKVDHYTIPVVIAGQLSTSGLEDSEVKWLYSVCLGIGFGIMAFILLLVFIGVK